MRPDHFRDHVEICTGVTMGDADMEAWMHVLPNMIEVLETNNNAADTVEGNAGCLKQYVHGYLSPLEV